MNTHSQPVGARRSGLRGSSLLAALGLAALPAQAVAVDGAGLAVLSPFSIAGIALIVGGAVALILPAMLKGRAGASKQTDTAPPAEQTHTAPVGEETLSYRGGTLRGRRIETRYEGDESTAKPPAPAAPVAAPEPAADAPPAKPSGPRLEPNKVLERAPDDEVSPAVAYNASGAARYVSGLTDPVLERAQVFFRALASDGEIDSADLARRLDAQPTELAGLLLTSLTRRASAVNSPAPFGIGRVKGTRRRLWLDSDKVAAKLDHAIEREIAKRKSGAAGRNGFHDAPEVKTIAESAR